MQNNGQSDQISSSHHLGDKAWGLKQGMLDKIHMLSSFFKSFLKDYVAILILLFSFLSLLLSEPVHVRDSWRYIRQASHFGLLDFDFWFGERSPGLPLILKLTGDGFWFTAFCCIFSAFSWIFFHGSLKLLGGKRSQDPFFNIVFLFIAFSSVFVSWNFVLLTESLSVSCLLVIVSILLRSMLQPFSVFYLGIVLVLCLFSFLRDFNSLISFLVILSATVFFRKRRVLFAGFLIISVVLFSFTFYSIKSLDHLGMKQRWVLPTLNNFSQRVMTHRNWEEFSKTYRIPVSGKLLELKNRWGAYKNPSYYKTKELGEFRVWFLKNGNAAYRKFIVQYPGNTLRMIRSRFFSAYQIRKCFTCNGYVDSDHEPLAFRTSMDVVFLLIFSWLIKQWIVFRSKKQEEKETINSSFLFSFSLGVISVLCVCFIIVMDPVEIPRHSILPLLLLVVSLLGMGLSMEKPQVSGQVEPLETDGSQSVE